MPRGMNATLRAEPSQGWPSIHLYPRHWSPPYIQGRVADRRTVLALSYLVRTEYQFSYRRSKNDNYEGKEPGFRTKESMSVCDRHRDNSLQHLPGRNFLLRSHPKCQGPIGDRGSQPEAESTLLPGAPCRA